MNPNGSPAIKQVNRRKSEGKSTEYFGVHYHIRKKKYNATIRENGKQKHLGSFDDPAVAYRAYLDAAKRIYRQPIREDAEPPTE